MHARIIAYFERKKDQAIERLVAVRERMTQARTDLTVLYGRLRDAERSVRVPRGGVIDIARLRHVEDYKGMLNTDIDRKRVEIDMLDSEERERRREALEAYKRYRLWRKIGQHVGARVTGETASSAPWQHTLPASHG